MASKHNVPPYKYMFKGLSTVRTFIFRKKSSTILDISTKLALGLSKRYVRKFWSKPCTWDYIFYPLPGPNRTCYHSFRLATVHRCQKRGYFSDLSKFLAFYDEERNARFRIFSIFLVKTLLLIRTFWSFTLLKSLPVPHFRIAHTS